MEYSAGTLVDGAFLMRQYVDVDAKSVAALSDYVCVWLEGGDGRDGGDQSDLIGIFRIAGYIGNPLHRQS
ncbi:hypothetical protein SAMN07250955_101368 [Arboricoccus pini]|uniref:Uncharacterized protein n=1 Tax=Arboricoccus pini TaxID=1963835 RepID=A0A212Q2M6_9PROT|nr:hypothetical protein [Arboricoccus pini]SNB53504.1 hypothetical protein SAMN07250955_101368 [Arboricoccus pini]